MLLRSEATVQEAWNACVSACQRAQRWEEAVHLFESIEQPDVVSFNAAMAAWAESGQWQQASRLFEALRQRKLKPSTASFNSCITAGEKAGLPYYDLSQCLVRCFKGAFI